MSTKKIILIRLDKIGDLIATLPADQVFTHAADEAAAHSNVGDSIAWKAQGEFQSKIQWIVAEGLEKIVRYSVPKRAFTVLSLKNKWHSFKKLVAYLIQEKPELIVYFYGPTWAYLAGFIARAFLRLQGTNAILVGRYSQWFSFLFLTNGLRQSRSLSEKPELQYNIEMAEFAKNYWQGNNKDNSSNNKSTDIANTAYNNKTNTDVGTHFNSHSKYFLKLDSHQIPSYEKLWEKIKTQFQLESKNYVVVHPGMAGSALNWPSHRWNELIQKLIQSHSYDSNFKVVITGTALDQKWLDPLRAQWQHHPQVAWTESALSFDELLLVLNHSQRTYAPSTGVLHLATALGVPVVGIYSPILSHHPRRWGPQAPATQDVQVLLPKLEHLTECPAKSKCLGPACPEYNCMEKISVDSLKLD